MKQSLYLIGITHFNSSIVTCSEGYYTDYPNGKVTTNSGSITSIPGDTLLELASWDMKIKDDGILINTYNSLDGNYDSDTTFWQKQGDNFVIGGQANTITTLTNSSLVYMLSFIETETYDDTLWFEETEAIYSFNR